jgi:hypothetical protein
MRVTGSRSSGCQLPFEPVSYFLLWASRRRLRYGIIQG